MGYDSGCSQRLASDAVHEGEPAGAQVQVQPQDGGDPQVSDDCHAGIETVRSGVTPVLL